MIDAPATRLAEAWRSTSPVEMLAAALGAVADGGLYLTPLLFASYLCMIGVGMREWRRSPRAGSRASQVA